MSFFGLDWIHDTTNTPMRKLADRKPSLSTTETDISLPELIAAYLKLISAYPKLTSAYPKLISAYLKLIPQYFRPESGFLGISATPSKNGRTIHAWRHLHMPPLLHLSAWCFSGCTKAVVENPCLDY